MASLAEECLAEASLPEVSPASRDASSRETFREFCTQCADFLEV